MRNPAHLLAVLLAACALSAPGRSGAQSGPCTSLGTICVGADAACHYADLAQAISAASTSSGASTTIRVATNKSWNAQNLLISNRNLTIRGGFSSCGALFPSGKTVLSGAGGSGESVIRVRAPGGFRTVVLRDLELTDGGNVAGPSVGGGVSIADNVAVTLRNVLVRGNAALEGGGIHVDGSDGAFVRLEVATSVVGNASRNGGGGIDCEGAADLEMDDTLVSENVTGVDAVSTPDAHGGGIRLVGCDLVATQAPTTALRGVRLNQSTGWGGGIYVGPGSQASFDGVGGAAFSIDTNQAGGDGGGVAVQGGSATLVDSRLSTNIAGSGAPGAGRGGGAALSTGLLRLMADDCPDCSVVSGNLVLSADAGIAGRGSALFAEIPEGSELFSDLRVARTRIQGHGAGSGQVVRAETAPDLFGLAPYRINLRLESVLVSANDASSLLSMSGAVDALVNGATIADNGAPVVVLDAELQSGFLTLANSIVREARGVRLLPDRLDGGLGFEFDAGCLLLHEGARDNQDLPALTGPSIAISDAPGFLNPSLGDYRLDRDAEAVDFCTGTDGFPDDDLAGRARGEDAPDVPDRIEGAFHDLGAFELQGDIWLFESGFES